MRFKLFSFISALLLVGCGGGSREAEVAMLKSSAEDEITLGLTYSRFAEQAFSEGYPNIAAMFEAVHHAEMYQAGLLMRQLRDMGESFSPKIGTPEPDSTRTNLYSAKVAEEHSSEVIYPEKIAFASEGKYPKLLENLKKMQRADSSNAALFIQTITQLESCGNDSNITPNWSICMGCGNIFEGAGFVKHCSLCE